MAGLGKAPVDLPQLVVVGSQSAGKSSVLEKIVGRDFLPRGNTIVTRRPLILQLLNTRLHRIGSDSKEWGVFLHKREQKMFSFEKIKREIMSETERVTGSNAGISAEPIRLKIFSPKVLDLTLVDLPGITKVPVGDQPKDIEKRIREMALQFIKNPNSIIVAVTPANSDMANSESLKLAREIDPKGDRTLGVLTKIDLMDKGTNAWDMLNGNVVSLKHGYVGVVNRSQLDIDQKKTVNQAIADEANFFKTHPAYRTISAKLGSTFLKQRLNAILVTHIKKVLPSMSAKIYQQLMKREQRLRELGTPVASDDNTGLMLQILLQYSKSFNDAIEGKLTTLNQPRGGPQPSPSSNDSALSGGSRISHIFHNVFAKSLAGIGPFDDLTDDQIRTAILNATATKPSLFVTEDSFQLLVKRQIARLKGPSIRCSELVYDELRRIATQCEGLSPALARFPALRQRLSACVGSLIRKRLTPTKAMISNLINIELSYIKTTHPNFISSSKAMALAKSEVSRKDGSRAEKLVKSLTESISSIQLEGGGDKLPNVPSVLRSRDISNYDKGMSETRIIKTLIQSYFKIVQKIIQDAVPKTVMHFLVGGCKSQIQTDLVKALYKPELCAELMAEEPHIKKEREENTKMLTVLRKAVKVLKAVQDIGPQGPTA